MDDILELVDQAIARWGTRELVSTSEAIDLLLDIRQITCQCDNCHPIPEVVS